MGEYKNSIQNGLHTPAPGRFMTIRRGLILPTNTRALSSSSTPFP